MSDPDTRPLKVRVREYVEQTDYVSFAELVSRFGDSFSAGDFALELRHNLVLWAGMTETASAAIHELLDEHVIKPHPASPMIYLIDGRSLTFPVAKRVRPYAKPHWLPVTLRPFDAATSP